MNQTNEPVFTNGNRQITMKDRNFTHEGKGCIQDNNFDFDATLYVTGDFLEGEKEAYTLMITNALNTIPSAEYAKLKEDAERYQWIKKQSSDIHVMFEVYDLNKGYADLMSAKCGQSLDQAIDAAIKDTK